MRFDPEVNRTMRAYKGAPLSVILAMLVYNCTMSKADLACVTGYSERKLDDVMLLLESDGLVQNNGYGNGWSLTDGIHQLPLFSRELLENFFCLAVDNPVDNHQTIVLSGPKSANSAELNELNTANSAELDSLKSANSAELNGFEVPNPQILRKDSANSADFLTRARARTVLTTTTTTLNNNGKGSSSKYTTPKDEIFALVEKQPCVHELLLAAGIGPTSDGMLKLLQMQMDHEYVQAHVRQFQYEQKSGADHSVGLLIRRFMDRDPPPKMRCEHLNLESCLICQYGDVIRR